MIKVILLLATITAILAMSAAGQDWKQIVPLKSTCEDVKRVFKTPSCKFPTTRIKGQLYNVTIDFAGDSSQWNVSKNTVVQVLFLFHDLPKLASVETNFKNYKIEREHDVENIVKYNNSKDGIEIVTQTGVAAGPYVSSIVLYPSLENSKKFACKK